MTFNAENVVGHNVPIFAWDMLNQEEGTLIDFARVQSGIGINQPDGCYFTFFKDTTIAETMSSKKYLLFETLMRPINPTVNNNVARTLDTEYTISETKHARVSYSINVSWDLEALLSGNATAFLEYSTDEGANWITVNQVSKNIGLLTFAGADDLNLTGEIPANALVRIRTAETNMTVAYTRGQEVLV